MRPVHQARFPSWRWIHRTFALAVDAPEAFEETPRIEPSLITSDLAVALVPPSCHPSWPVLSVLNNVGKIRPGAMVPPLSIQEWRKMYEAMVMLQEMDTIFYSSQRQGRISFYMTCSGEEAVNIGSAAALDIGDTVFAQYREQGVLLWRGFGRDQFAHQLFSNAKDLGKGRQMPIHYGSRDLNFQTISSPLTTQLPQAVGAAFAKKMEGSQNCVVCYFGEGAASEGDFHAAFNFATTLEVPVVFFCRNNGYAISTATTDQFAGDGIISRAVGYGMHGIRVDGNDLLAVYAATAAAKELAVRESKPVVVEAMSYRVGHHSTSDDSTRYRSLDEIKQWKEGADPLVRCRAFLEDREAWNSDLEASLRAEERMKLLNAIEAAESIPKPGLDELFNDVYDEKPPHLERQEAELTAHLDKYRDRGLY